MIRDIMKAIDRKTTRGLPRELRQALLILLMREARARMSRKIESVCRERFGPCDEGQSNVIHALTGTKPSYRAVILVDTIELNYEYASGETYRVWGLIKEKIDWRVDKEEDPEFYSWVTHLGRLDKREDRLVDRRSLGMAKKYPIGEWVFAKSEKVVLILAESDKVTAYYVPRMD